MLIGHLAWYADACHAAPFHDPRTRANVLEILMPDLARERREVLQAAAQARRAAGTLPAELRRLLLETARACRRAMQAALRRAGVLDITADARALALDDGRAEIYAAHYDPARALLTVAGRRRDGRALILREAWHAPLDLTPGEQHQLLCERAADAVAEAVGA
ncbi:hypothetical protein [Azohydromonas aeria]|uniref:hypothetical protein n=1 Tax=Azohydromonas aeria TaxID=2590212 RepID=UPI0012F9D885|nr:hypothetical protein [Azohydromonas aeria]